MMAAHPILLRAVFVGLILAASTLSFAQSQALNGQIEGTVSDLSNAAIANATISVTNLENGVNRTATSDEDGVYRFPLLPLGTYRITAEAANFKKVIREGITLTTGQTATVDFSLPAGEIQEVVTVLADSSIADAGKTDLGRVIDPREVKNLPLISRNPYNFALLQANVTGRPSPGNPFPTVNANGYPRRVNYLLDGNTNTQADRAGVRLMLITETLISEVQLVTNGFAAEFGNTPGLIMNAVTPSGTNDWSGSFSYRFSRTPFYSRPFFYDSPADLPENNSDNFTAAIGAPIIKNRWHFFFGYEWLKRDDNIGRLVTIEPSHKAQLIAAGLPASIFPPVIPNSNKNINYIFRTDAELNSNNRLTARFIDSYAYSINFSPSPGRSTLERAADANSFGYSLGTQLVSFNSKVLNELRLQFAERISKRVKNEFSGASPSITITNVASFGAPTDADAINPLEKITQVQDNLTWTRGAHVIKFGGGFNFIDDFKRQPIVSSYTFSTINAYIAARNGDPYSYNRYEETFGNPEIKYKSTFWNFFVQDDWKLTRRLKINLGLRYDLYLIPEADPNAPLPISRRFNVDKNNFAPRLGIVYALREGARPTVLRLGAGIYYETPWLNMYERALLRNGNPRFFDSRFFGNNGGTRHVITDLAPAFPNNFSGSFPAGSGLPLQNIDTIAPDFENMYAIHSNVQLEQAITENLSLTLGFIHSGGRHIAVYRNINLIPFRFLADGRPVYEPSDSKFRVDPRFGNIFIAESAGVSRYNALTLQLTQRFSRGIQFGASYTLSKATDDAPEQNLSTGNFQNLQLTAPFNRSLDKGRSFADQRHTFVMSLAASPQFNIENRRLRYLFNNNQVGIIARANSGETFNIVSKSDLNNDGVTNGIFNLDRPLGIRRNSETTPPQFNVDLRYSRFFNLSERYKFEILGEFINLFNINSIIAFTDVSVPTNADGELIGKLPDFKARNQSISQDSRQFQLGFKFIF